MITLLSLEPKCPRCRSIHHFIWDLLIRNPLINWFPFLFPLFQDLFNRFPSYDYFKFLIFLYLNLHFIIPHPSQTTILMVNLIPVFIHFINSIYQFINLYLIESLFYFIIILILHNDSIIDPTLTRFMKFYLLD